MLDTQLITQCAVCAHDDTGLIAAEIIEEGDLEKIARKYGFTYTDVQEHAQHINLDEILPSEELEDKIASLKERLENTSNPADIVYIMTLIMKYRVSPLLSDESASGLAQLDKINKAIRENASVVAKLREQMREGDQRRIAQLQEIVSIYRSVLLDMCTDCNAVLTEKVEKAASDAKTVEKEMLSEESYEAIEEELPSIPDPIVS